MANGMLFFEEVLERATMRYFLLARRKNSERTSWLPGEEVVR